MPGLVMGMSLPTCLVWTCWDCPYSEVSGFYWNAELFEEKAGLGCLGTTDLVV